MARARLPSAERWLVGLISVLTFTVALQLTILLCSGSDAGLAKTQGASHKHISRFVVPTAFNSSLEKRGKSVDSDDYMGDDESSLSDSSARSSSLSGKQGGQQADYDRKSQQDDGEEGKDIVYQNHNWNKCVRKGSELVGLFSRPSIPKADESRFTDYRDLQRYGWEVLEKGIDPTHEDNTLSKPLDMLKIAHGKGVPEDKWHYLQVTHSKDSRDASGGYPATDGKFHMTHNPQDHIIIAEDLLSPASTASGTWLSPQHVTPLKFVSDVMFLNWVYECRQTKSSPASLKYYMVPSIVNYDTRSAVREAVGGFLAKQLPAWPGVVFTKDQDGDKFSALLGTPVGGSIARMLVQRKSTMGRDRSIVGIRVWAEQPGSDRWFKEHGPVLSMLFELSGLRSNPSRTNAGADSSAGHVQQIRRSPRRGGGRRPWHNTPPVRSAVPAVVSAVSEMADDATASAVAFQGHVSAAASRASDMFGGATAAATVLRGQGSAAVSKASGLLDGATASASVLQGKGPAVASKASSLFAAMTSSAVSQRQGTAAASVASTSFSSANGSSIADWKARRSLQKSGLLSRAAEDHKND